MTEIDDPRRLFESDDAPAELRDWLTRAHHDVYSEAAAAQLVKAVEQCTLRGAPRPTQISTWHSIAKISSVSKLLWAFAIAGLSGGIWYVHQRSASNARGGTNGIPSSSTRQVTAELNEAQAVLPAMPPRVKEDVNHGSVAPELATGATTRSVASALPAAVRVVPAVSATSASLRAVASGNAVRFGDTPTGNDEFQLLRAARQAAVKEPATALQLTDEHLRRFPGGVLAQERESIAIESLVNLGRTSVAASRAKQFLSAYPNSPYRSRIEAAMKRISAP